MTIEPAGIAALSIFIPLGFVAMCWALLANAREKKNKKRTKKYFVRAHHPQHQKPKTPHPTIHHIVPSHSPPSAPANSTPLAPVQPALSPPAQPPPAVTVPHSPARVTRRGEDSASQDNGLSSAALHAADPSLRADMDANRVPGAVPGA
ncbi:hypothetical protein NX059_000769 [Plenodomus lindquistii]|nr:hypothetical protein NX059_000769 [Plenodomus lindquistii]